METHKERESMKLHNNEMRNLYSLPSNTRMINSKRMRRTVHAAWKEIWKVYKKCHLEDMEGKWHMSVQVQMIGYYQRVS